MGLGFPGLFTNVGTPALEVLSQAIVLDVPPINRLFFYQGRSATCSKEESGSPQNRARRTSSSQKRILGIS
jgi:hypothetical protein